MTLGAGSAVVLAAVISLADLISPFLEPGSREARRAQDHYRNEEWVEAIEELQSAVAEQEDPALSYNLGAAAYKGQNYPEALKAYSAAVQSGEIDPARVAYDQGNVLYQSGELEAALESYRSALRSDPDDEDARFNYELTLRQLEQEEKQEPGDQDENEQQDSDAPRDSTGQSQEDEQPQGEGEEQPDEQQGEGEQGEDQQQGSGGEEDQQPPQDGEGAQRQEGQLLSPEEAKRLLNAITPEERELIKARLRSSKRRKVEKDW